MCVYEEQPLTGRDINTEHPIAGQDIQHHLTKLKSEV